jgi:hypothetical protein
MRHGARALSFLLLLGSCAPEPDGPVAPIAPEQIAVAPALDASAARQAVVDFVSAYAASPTEGVGALANAVAGTELLSWVRWLDVQHREFSGGIRGGADILDVEFIRAIDARRPLAQVGLSAAVTFEFDPEGADAFERRRNLYGSVTLIQTETGVYKVVDLSRDGVPMSDGIQIFEDETRSKGGVSVTLDSLFMFPPNWQFNVVVRNTTEEVLLLDPEASGLFVEGTDGVERMAGVVTGSLAAVPPGGLVDGILAYPLQEAGEGRMVSLVYLAGRETIGFDFPLDGLVTVVPPPPLAPDEGSAKDVTA